MGIRAQHAPLDGSRRARGRQHDNHRAAVQTSHDRALRARNEVRPDVHGPARSRARELPPGALARRSGQRHRDARHRGEPRIFYRHVRPDRGSSCRARGMGGGAPRRPSQRGGGAFLRHVRVRLLDGRARRADTAGPRTRLRERGRVRRRHREHGDHRERRPLRDLRRRETAQGSERFQIPGHAERAASTSAVHDLAVGNQPHLLLRYQSQGRRRQHSANDDLRQQVRYPYISDRDRLLPHQMARHNLLANHGGLRSER